MQDPKGCTEYISSVVGSSCSNQKTLVFSGHDCANLVRIWLAVSSELKFKNVLKFWFFKFCHHWVFECSHNWNFQVLSKYKPMLGHLAQRFSLTDKRELLRAMWVIHWRSSVDSYTDLIITRNAQNFQKFHFHLTTKFHYFPSLEQFCPTIVVKYYILSSYWYYLLLIIFWSINANWCFQQNIACGLNF